MIKNLILHFNLINKHRFKVFKLCVKAGIPFRGLVHDLSKYSPVEFFESAKYYRGNVSPLSISKKENGYSKAWLHHKGINKHHHEYWYDYSAPVKCAIIPYKYTVEMICDSLSASMTYQKDNWTPSFQLEYYLKEREKIHINPKIDAVLIDVYTKVSEEGIDEVIKPKVLKKIYEKHVGYEKGKN